MSASYLSILIATIIARERERDRGAPRLPYEFWWYLIDDSRAKIRLVKGKFITRPIPVSCQRFYGRTCRVGNGKLNTRELAHALSVRLFSPPSYAFCLRPTLFLRPETRWTTARTSVARSKCTKIFETSGKRLLKEICCKRGEMFGARKSLLHVPRAIVYEIIDIGDWIFILSEPCQVWFLFVVAEKCRWRSEAIRLEMGTVYLLLNRIRVKLVVRQISSVGNNEINSYYYSSILETISKISISVYTER